jgi:hypothetical protein
MIERIEGLTSARANHRIYYQCDLRRVHNRQTQVRPRRCTIGSHQLLDRLDEMITAAVCCMTCALREKTATIAGSVVIRIEVTSLELGGQGWYFFTHVHRRWLALIALFARNTVR